MAIIKCKMCGGDLNIMEGASTAQCEYCGSMQTIPNLDDEKKLIQFERAERLRKQCEFDKAAGIYETIVADFRQEAEAYWGLVLCKYGIEYVDDPATGKKIPTCHRSSFDSIMDDSDFEQALENADPTARKVYRDEAKAIEEIRKGIISVSNNEKPYDIFICYKETDENGDRTLDSVLAQDVYDALTDKGYRVFFARISLEDKLGMEYEPYIFAALNSAKIMLAFGTDYEYFNAVWVKNEWSRFLKLMAKDKNKHLIPCFKGIDAYDMPKEFARLQAQDLGKVGAIQDLLRGIEKLLPRQAETAPVIQERVVVGGSGSNKIASLLDRGNMALEDGDWAKADSFFEDVLNNDSKNAQAYLGKTLAQERCRTIDAFIRKRKDATAADCLIKDELPADKAHIQSITEQFSLPGYVHAHELQNLYDFDLSFATQVAYRLTQFQEEKNYWQNHKTLSRAEKFAVGAVAENLQREKSGLLAVLSDRVKKAEAAEAAAIKEVQERYAQHLKQADEAAEALYNAGLARREQEYQQWLAVAKTSDDVSKLELAADKLEQFGDYQDSKNLARHCHNRIAEVQAKLDAEAERQAAIRAEKEKQKRKKYNTIILVTCAICAAIFAFVVIMSTVVVPGINYNKANDLLAEGAYLEAMEIYYRMPKYKDCDTHIRAFEDQVAAQLTGATWWNEPYIYQYNFNGGNGKTYDMASQHTIAFDESLNCTYTWWSISYIYGSQDEESRGDFEHQYQCEITVEDGDVIITGFSGVSAFADGRLVAECQINNDQIKLLALHGVDTVGDGNSVVIYPHTDEEIAAAEEAERQAKLEEDYNAAWAQLNADKYDAAYDAFAALGDYKDSTAVANEIARQLNVIGQIELLYEEFLDIEDMETWNSLLQSLPTGGDILVRQEDVALWRQLYERFLPFSGAFKLISGNRQLFEEWCELSTSMKAPNCDYYVSVKYSPSDGRSDDPSVWIVNLTYRKQNGAYYTSAVNPKAELDSDTPKRGAGSLGSITFSINSDGNLVVENHKNNKLHAQCVLKKIDPGH